MDNSIPEVREREGNWKNPFPQFGNGKGMKKNHSQNSGMGREWKNLFPKFGNGKGMKKIHSHNSGTGREWKKSIPTIREWESEAIIPKNTREREREWKKNKMIWQYKKILRKYVAWEGVLAHKFSTPSSSIPDNPPSSCHCHGHYQCIALQWTKKMILFTITNTFAA